MPRLMVDLQVVASGTVGVDSFGCELQDGPGQDSIPTSFVSGIGVEGSGPGEDKSRRNFSVVRPRADKFQESRGLCLGRDIIPATRMRCF